MESGRSEKLIIYASTFLVVLFIFGLRKAVKRRVVYDMLRVYAPRGFGGRFRKVWQEEVRLRGHKQSYASKGKGKWKLGKMDLFSGLTDGARGGWMDR